MLLTNKQNSPEEMVPFCGNEKKAFYIVIVLTVSTCETET